MGSKLGSHIRDEVLITKLTYSILNVFKSRYSNVRLITPIIELALFTFSVICLSKETFSNIKNKKTVTPEDINTNYSNQDVD
jgi:hypothetical protein